MVTNRRYNEVNGPIEFVANHFSMFASSIFKRTIAKALVIAQGIDTWAQEVMIKLVEA